MLIQIPWMTQHDLHVPQTSDIIKTASLLILENIINVISDCVKSCDCNKKKHVKSTYQNAARESKGYTVQVWKGLTDLSRGLYSVG